MAQKVPQFGRQARQPRDRSKFADRSSRPPSPWMPLPPDLDPDEDLLNPRAREAKLQRVQALAVANSAFLALFEALFRGALIMA